MRLASRMERIGTETAFEAAARARALEATGRHVIHLEMGEPDFDTPRNVSERAAHGAPRRGRDALHRGHRHPAPARGDRGRREALEGDRRLTRPGGRHARREADHVLRAARAHRGRRRGHLPEPGLPDLRVDGPLRRRHRRCRAAARGRRLPDGRRRGREPDHAAHEAADHELAPQPDRLDPDRCGHPPPGGAGRRARPRRPGRRDLRPPPVLRRAVEHRDAARHGGAHDHPRRVQQDLRDDRLAPRLRDRARVAQHRPSAASSSTACRARTPSPSSAPSRR